MVLLGQVKTTGEELTVKVAMQVFGASQLLVTVKVTVLLPPHAGGAPVLLLVSTELQPPLNETVASQVAYFESMVA